MNYFKYGDVVRHIGTGYGYYEPGEWVVIRVDENAFKSNDDRDDQVTVTNQGEIFSSFGKAFILVRPTPEERAIEKLGEDYL